MPISIKDIKKLWGLSAGKCGFPGCNTDCIQFLGSTDATILGEMAHIIGKKPSAARANGQSGEDTYENLILLCPTHHTIIDKAPEGTFPKETLYEWKNNHESKIAQLLNTKVFDNLTDLTYEINLILTQNKIVWQTFGPESKEANDNPTSTAYTTWELRKLDTIVPNNTKICLLLESYMGYFPQEEMEICYSFIEHAKAFEANCYVRREGTPTFPNEFAEVIQQYAKSK